MPRLKLFFLGAPRIERDGVHVFVDTRKAVALLAYLAVSGGSHSRDSLAAMFWPDADGSRARAALRRTLSALKTAVGGIGLDVERETLRLEESPEFWIDVREFQSRLSRCHQRAAAEDPPGDDCLEAFRASVELYNGDFLEGFSLRDSPAFDDWQFFQSEGFRRQLASALEKLAIGYSRRKDFETAISYARRWVAADPLREEAHRQLMQLYAESGQRNAALRQYRECVRILEQELGVSPLEETTGLYQAILENKIPPSEAPSPEAPSPQLSSSPTSITSFAVGLPLVGRSQETVVLLRAYEKAASGGFFLALEGEAGIGKTRLAEELLGYARSKGSVIVSGRSYEGESTLVYGPFIEALRSALELPGSAARLKAIPAHCLAETARLLPELALRVPGLPPTSPLDGLGAHGRFLEGLAQVLLGLCACRPGGPPGVLFLDDLHTADAATLNLLAYLARRLRGHSLFILATWRKEAIPPDHPLLPLIADVQRASTGSILSLSRLGPNHVADLVQSAAAAGLVIPPGLGDRLYQEAEGLPFFVVEYLTSLVEGANLGESGDWMMPHSVRDLLRARLAKVNDAGWQLLAAAAVIGRSFDYETLRQSSGRSEAETVSGLEGLISQGLIQEQEDRNIPVYDFNHEKLRELVYEETSIARRRLLHRRVAEALIEGARTGQTTSAHAAQIARHYQLAGQEGQAAEFFRLAGEHARSLAAHAEALAYFQAALAASASSESSSSDGRARTAVLYEAIGDLQTLLGSYNAALKSYETAAALCEPDCLARVEHKLGDLYQRRGDWELSESHYQIALDALEEFDEPGERARLYADWAQTSHHREQSEQAQELARKALDLAEKAGEPRALAQAHNILGILARHAYDFTTASHHLEDSLTLAERLGDAGARVSALNNLALAYGDQDKLDSALALASKALNLCTLQGDRHREAALHNNLADLLHRSGRSDEAMEHLKKAVVIFAEVGETTTDGANHQASANRATSPEIWKLTEW